jgi:hypothetical protein
MAGNFPQPPKKVAIAHLADHVPCGQVPRTFLYNCTFHTWPFGAVGHAPPSAPHGGEKIPDSLQRPYSTDKPPVVREMDGPRNRAGRRPKGFTRETKVLVASKPSRNGRLWGAMGGTPFRCTPWHGGSWPLRASFPCACLRSG